MTKHVTHGWKTRKNFRKFKKKDLTSNRMTYLMIVVNIRLVCEEKEIVKSKDIPLTGYRRCSHSVKRGPPLVPT